MAVWALKIVVVLTMGGFLLRSIAAHRRWRRWERDRRLELEAYCTLEMALPTHGDPRKRTERAKRVARMVVDRSVFAHCAVFLPDERSRLVCAGSCGMDDLSLEALNAWCGQYQIKESASETYSMERLGRDVRRSFSVPLALEDKDWGLARPACVAATLIPIRLQRGRLIGLLAVCGARERKLSPDRSEEAVVPLELLAAKLARTLERAMLMDRLIQVERLAGAAQLAAGVAEALVEPLRDVRDRAELITGTTNEARIRDHTRAILSGVEGMSETLNTLREAWRPRAEGMQPVGDRRATS